MRRPGLLVLAYDCDGIYRDHRDNVVYCNVGSGVYWTGNGLGAFVFGVDVGAAGSHFCRGACLVSHMIVTLPIRKFLDRIVILCAVVELIVWNHW